MQMVLYTSSVKMIIRSISVFVIAFVSLDLCAGQADLPSLCCVTGDRINYAVNTTFITSDCKSKCVCTHDTYLACIPLCPKAILKCPVGFKQQVVNTSVTYSNQVCYCPKYDCVPISIPGPASLQKNCSEGNKLYKPGEEFVRNCNKRCRCYGSGLVKCVSLCPNVKSCMVDHTDKNVLVPTANNKCQCAAKACKPLPYKDNCILDDEHTTYKSGDSFLSSDCSSKCTCHPGGKFFCIPLCKPLGNDCKVNEQAIQVQENVYNSTCTCPALKCVTSTQASTKYPALITQHTCTVSSGKIYLIGSVFSDNNCTSQCYCQNGGVISCHALCLPAVPDGTCTNPKTVQKSSSLPDAQGNTCSCSVVTCS